MGKETVRYPDALVARIEEVVANSRAFESKSEFHRFASDFLLTLLDPDHESSVLGYADILADLEADLEATLTPDLAGADDGDVPFLEAYVQVRHHLLHGEADEAREYVADAYDVGDREALLLDELVGRHARESDGPSRTRATPTLPADDRTGVHVADQRVPTRSNGGRDLDTRDERGPDQVGLAVERGDESPESDDPDVRSEARAESVEEPPETGR